MKQRTLEEVRQWLEGELEQADRTMDWSIKAWIDFNQNGDYERADEEDQLQTHVAAKITALEKALDFLNGGQGQSVAEKEWEERRDGTTVNCKA